MVKIKLNTVILILKSQKTKWKINNSNNNTSHAKRRPVEPKQLTNQRAPKQQQQQEPVANEKPPQQIHIIRQLLAAQVHGPANKRHLPKSSQVLDAQLLQVDENASIDERLQSRVAIIDEKPAKRAIQTDATGFVTTNE